MSRKSTIDALFLARQAAPETAVPPTLGAPNKVPVRSGAVAAIGHTLQQWGETARQAGELQVQLANAQTVLEIDPALVAPAPVRDRLPVEDDRSLLALKQSIRNAGQQVPILVRPHPEMPGQFQAAFGHRRLMACEALGIKVRAVIANLSDEELVMAQGHENKDRRDLSFIEVALFALRLEQAGYPRALVVASLGIDKGDVSRVIGVARGVPEPLVRLIGPAPKAGRARWMALTQALTRAGASDRAERATLKPEFANGDTDQRFVQVLAAAQHAGAMPPAQQRMALHAPGGQQIGWLRETNKAAQIEIIAGAASGFASYVAAHLPDLYEKFQAGQGGAAASPRIRSFSGGA